MIVKAEQLPEDPNVRFVVTNLSRPGPARIYAELYVARGDALSLQRGFNASDGFSLFRFQGDEAADR